MMGQPVQEVIGRPVMGLLCRSPHGSDGRKAHEEVKLMFPRHLVQEPGAHNFGLHDLCKAAPIQLLQGAIGSNTGSMDDARQGWHISLDMREDAA